MPWGVCTSLSRSKSRRRDDARRDALPAAARSPPRLRLILPHEQETRDGAGLQGIADGPRALDNKRSLGGAAVAPGERANQGNGWIGGGR